MITLFRLVGQRVEWAERFDEFAPNEPLRQWKDQSWFFPGVYVVCWRFGLRSLSQHEIASIVGSTHEDISVRLNAKRCEGTIYSDGGIMLVRRREP